MGEEKLKDIKTATDKIYDAQKKDVDKDCKNVCSNHKFENYEEQLKKLSKYYKGCVKKIEPKHDDIKNATKKFEKIVKKKGDDDGRYKAMKNKCDLIAYRMNKKK